MKKLKLRHIAEIPILVAIGLLTFGTKVDAKSYDSNSEAFEEYRKSNENNYFKIKNISGNIVSLAKYKTFKSIQKNGKPIQCNSSTGFNVTNSEICYYNTKGQGYQKYLDKTGASADSAGRTIFNSLVYGKIENIQYRMYFPISEDKLYTDAIGYLYANKYLKEESQNFKYYGSSGDGVKIGYRWWNINKTSYCYYDNGIKCTAYTSKSAQKIRDDVKNSSAYLEGLSYKNSENGEYRFLGYSSYGELYNNPIFPSDYPTSIKFKDYPFIDNPAETLVANKWAIAPTGTDLDPTLKRQAAQIVIDKYNIQHTVDEYINKWSLQGNPNYDPIVAVGVHRSKKYYNSATTPTRPEAVKNMSVKQIKVCEGSITDINKCKLVGEWSANGSNFYSDGSISEGLQDLIYGQQYTVFTKLTNKSASATNINGTAISGEGGGVDANGNVTINSTISNNQGKKIAANSDSDWIATKPFTAGYKFINGYETVVSGVSSSHIDNADDNDVSDNYGAIKFKVVPSGNMEIIQIKAYDIDDTTNSHPVTELTNGKEYKFVIDTKFIPTIKDWSSPNTVIMPLNVTIDRVFTNGSSEHNTQIAYPNGSAYQTLSEKTYQYTVYGSAGMPGTDVKIRAEFTKDNTLGFNSTIDSKDVIESTYQVPTIKADISAKGPIYAIDKNNNKVSTESDKLDSSKTYKLIYQTVYNGDVISKNTTPIKTQYSCYYTNVQSKTATVACNNLQGLTSSGTVNSAYILVNGNKYDLSKNGNTWYSSSITVASQGNITLYVNNEHRGTFYHDLSSPVYRGAGYPKINNVEVLGKLFNNATGMTRETKSYFNLDFETIANQNGKDVMFTSTTKDYYGFPMFNHQLDYKTDNNKAALNAKFAYADRNNQRKYSRVNNLNTNPDNDTYTYKNNVNISLTDVTIYPGKEEMLKDDACPVYEVRYNVSVSENSVLKNAQGLVTTQVKFAGKTYTFSDYLVEGENKGISHILNNVDCSKINDGKPHPVEVTVNSDKVVNETTFNDNTKSTNTILKVIDNNKSTVTDKDMMDVKNNLGYDCDTTTNTFSWKETHTVRNWKESLLGDVIGYTSSANSVTKTYSESYKITNVSFASKNTNWKKVDLLKDNSKATIKAGYGFKLTATVEYYSNVIANNMSLNNHVGKSDGTQVSNLNIEAYLPEVMYAKYDGVTYALYADSSKSSNGTITRTYSYKGKYNGKDTDKIFTNVNSSDGLKPITISTPRIIGIPTHLNKCLRDTKNTYITIDGSMYDDMNSHITQ